MLQLDTIDAQLIELVQYHFPVVREPYKTIAETLGCSEEEVLVRMQRLVDEGVIRDIGPIYDLGALGFASTLVAFKIPNDAIDQAGAIINEYAGVSHNYEREGEYNLWFTLTAPSEEELALILEELTYLVKPERALDVPVLRTLKIKTHFVTPPCCHE